MLLRFKKTITLFVSRHPLSSQMIPFLILGIALLAFSIKTLNTGFFHDDWHHVYYAYNFGLDGLKQFLFFDSRPLAYIVYGPLFSSLGVNPRNWHLLVLFLRFFTVAVFFWNLNLITRKFQKQNGLIALLFLIYPVFQVQPNSVSYALHWVTYLVFMLSLLFMILAIRNVKFRVVFTVISLLLEVFHLLMLEYFAGVELIRIFLIWYLLRDNLVKTRLKKALVYWAPYLAILAAYTVFRISYSRLLGYDRNSPVILLGLLSTPLDSILFLVQSAIRDLVDILLTTWSETYNPAYINFSVFTNIWIWAFAGLVSLISWVFFAFIPDQEHKEEEQRVWAKTLVFLGFIFVILSFLPTWLTGRTFFDIYDLFDDRFALPAMFGASMIWGGAVFYLIKKPVHSYIITFILIGLAVALQLRTNTEYSQSWDKQSKFYWQLYWRAPYIEPETAFISEGEIFMYMGTHPTMYAINTLYGQNDDVKTFDYS
ncbi:MAG: hypothetical protein HN392_10880, partial [Anaerolineae bacterium]|nr:hypothetical protein [Anaerolineae bacterium]